MENIFLKGGIFMLPLLLCLIITVIIIFERWLYWLSIKIDNNYSLRHTLVKSKPDNDYLETIKGEHGDSTITLVCEALRRKQLSQAEINNQLKLKHFAHNRFMRVLDVITSVAPLFGILGTIWGIINSFNLAGVINNIDPAVAMIGMSEAFITTAFGLLVSLSALFAFNYFQSLSEKELIGSDIFLTDILVKIEANE